MTNEIRPALTPEEWEMFNKQGHGPHDGPLRDVELRDEVIAVFPQGEGWYGKGTDRHALAALALHGQPFGFTREDVELLREHIGRDCHAVHSQAAMHLADRIAALLPPEPTP